MTLRMSRFTLLALSAVELRNGEEQLVLLDPELRALAYRQQHRVLLLAGTNAIHHTIGLQHVFLAEHLALFLVRSIGSQDLSGKLLPLFSSIPHGTASIFEIVPAWRKIGLSFANASDPSIKKQIAIVDFMAPPGDGGLNADRMPQPE